MDKFPKLIKKYIKKDIKILFINGTGDNWIPMKIDNIITIKENNVNNIIKIINQYKNKIDLFILKILKNFDFSTFICSIKWKFIDIYNIKKDNKGKKIYYYYIIFELLKNPITYIIEQSII